MDPRRAFMHLVDDAIDYLKTGFREKKEPHSAPGDVKGDGRTGLSKIEQMRAVNEQIVHCSRCRLHQHRLNAVPGEGNIDAGILFIGEGPGEMEDIKGKPFVGRAGELLTRMLAAIQLTREEVYITNIVKCRPPQNRNPLPDEVASCAPYLEKQIDLINPLIICCLGGSATKALLGTDRGVSALRGRVHQYRDIPLIPTYHPAAVLRFPEKYKRDVWNDLKMLRDLYADRKKSHT